MCKRIHLYLHLPAIYADAYTDSYSAAKSNPNTNNYAYFDAETFTDTEERANAAAASHSTAAPVALP